MPKQLLTPEKSLIKRAKKKPAPRNRTLKLSRAEMLRYKDRLIHLSASARKKDLLDKTICQDSFDALRHLPENSIDLLFADPPYNLTKAFNARRFRSSSLEQYEAWLDSWLSQTLRVLKPTASVYLCGDWRSSAAIHRIGTKYFQLRNRITWEREKGRGARANWKNCSEDIWFFTVSSAYTFNVGEVLLKRRVLAPYTENGQPKEWTSESEGRFRLTHPSNLWTDVTVPFWSMPENTEHPTQKPEKLLAKIILASSRKGDLILDPFAGSGTTCVVAKKLKRRFIGIEIDERFCCLIEKRLQMADSKPLIQGYADGVFWDRNTFGQQSRSKKT
ncbi:MAG: site-specific DNA-methyltransferase [Pyrinomonadaceae bacterium]|nr:site-specific DNA-methyltransferase [Pyrinomonadaceae bacterium]